jgi:uncharacterized protein (DUF983 family)
MADVIDMKEYFSVRFFKRDILCGFCGNPTRGRVYDSGEAIVCTECGGPMMELESDDFAGNMTIIFDPEAS